MHLRQTKGSSRSSGGFEPTAPAKAGSASATFAAAVAARSEPPAHAYLHQHSLCVGQAIRYLPAAHSCAGPCAAADIATFAAADC